ncbi:MAG: hypothetical protein K6F32_06450 [Bacilli bacterium]|nr:hypothetical protein [Bacilli bacterium]
MKKIFTLAFIPVLFAALTGCGNNNSSTVTPTYQDDVLYTEARYEPLDVASDDPNVTVSSTDLLGVYGGVKAAAWDDCDIKLRVNYSDSSLHDFPLKVVNIPLEMRHYLGEVGEHRLNIVEYKWTVSHAFTIIENPDWHGYKCEFFDKDKNYLATETVGFYEDVKYNGPVLPSEQEDADYKYQYAGWNRSTSYIHQDTQFMAKYKKTEKRFYAVKPFNNDHIGLSALVNQEGNKGSALVYLGRVRHVAAFHTEAVELDNEDLEFTFQVDEYGKYWNEFNEAIVKNSIRFEDELEYGAHIYGEPYSLISRPTFGLQFDSRYDYKGIKGFLEDQSDVTLSSTDPYDGVLDVIMDKVEHYVGTGKVSKDDEPGFYRYSIVLSFDVYLSVSFNKLDEHVYEIGAFNSFIMAPVRDTAQCIVQHSEDGEFCGDFDQKLVLSTKGLYYAAEMIDWNK